MKGEQYNVDNYVTPSSIANVHNHPNGTPPLFRDILFTAKTAKDKDLANNKATFVYDSKNKIYYVLYIKNRAQAALFYDKYNSFLDEKTNGFNELLSENLILLKSCIDCKGAENQTLSQFYLVLFLLINLFVTNRLRNY